jgi:hypothetical protein
MRRLVLSAFILLSVVIAPFAETVSANPLMRLQKQVKKWLAAIT